MHYLYVLQDTGGRFYIGQTSDLKRRVTQHKIAKPQHKLIYYEAYQDASVAIKREWQLKQYGGAWRSLRLRILTKKRAG